MADLDLINKKADLLLKLNQLQGLRSQAQKKVEVVSEWLIDSIIAELQS